MDSGGMMMTLEASRIGKKSFWTFCVYLGQAQHPMEREQFLF
jgi:hypothetical protein